MKSLALRCLTSDVSRLHVVVALKRVNDFLWKSPLIDELDEDSDETWTGFRGGATFSWYSELPEVSQLFFFHSSVELPR